MYKVGVIGLGCIAAMYGKPEDAAPYCHIGGIRHSDRVALTAVADMSEAAREKFRSVWAGALPEDLRWYDSSTAMLANEELDIVAVCVRGPHHCAVTTEVIQAGPRAIFLEKPPSCSLVEMDAMVAAAKAAAIPITVSYSRHWAPHVLRLQEMVRQGLIGEVQTVVGYTGHSFLSFASHTTDLVCQFAGYCPTAVFARGKVSGEAPEGYEPEPALDSMVIEFENGVTGIQVGAPGEHGGFYVDVFGTEGYVRAGIYIPPFARNKKDGVLGPAVMEMPANASVFKVAYDQIAGHLDGGPLPHCTGAEWAAVNEVGFAGIESVHTGRRIPLPNANRTRKAWANG